MSTLSDEIVTARVLGSKAAEYRAFDLAHGRSTWFSPMEIEVDGVVRGSRTGKHWVHHASRNVPPAGTNVVLFGRNTADTTTREPFIWVGAAGVGWVREGGVVFPNGKHESPSRC